MTDNLTPPTPNLFDDQLRQVLAVINMANSDGSNWISSLDVSRKLLGEYNLNVHWRTIDKILSERKDLVRRKKQRKRWCYTLLADGEDLLVSRPESAVALVNPGEAVQAVVSLHDTLGSLNGDIRICDPYLDPATVEHLDACPTSSRIMLLTCNIRKRGRLRRMLAAAQTTGHNIEIREDAQKDIHDRYVIDNDSMLILGTSLNGFGKKEHFVIKAGKDIRGMALANFNSRWSSAKPWS